MLSIGIPGGRAVRVPWAAMTPAGGFAWNWRRYWGMGFNPMRAHRRRPSDLVYVGATVVVAVLLVVWAMLG